MTARIVPAPVAVAPVEDLTGPPGPPVPAPAVAEPATDTPAAGVVVPNWVNRSLFVGDNLHVMRGLNTGSVDLIYADPPFNSDKDWNAPIGSKAAGAHFKDRWTLDDVDERDHDLLRRNNPALHDAVLTAGHSGGKPTMSYALYMSVRLVEMRRVLKPAGSLFLHCDDTERDTLKLLCDIIFGRRLFRNAIVWRRNSSHSDNNYFGNVADTILFYSGTPIRKNNIRVPLSAEQQKRFRYEDGRGRYECGDMGVAGLSGGGYEYEFGGYHGIWRYPERTIRELDREGRIHYPQKTGGRPVLKRYLSEHKGIVPPNVWDDIPKATKKERVGYPTQKPVALLERIIRAGTDEGDVVFDPFAGCATTAIAAERTGRQWAGCDLSDKAAELVAARMTADLGLPGTLAVIRTDIPQRTDLGKLAKPATHKNRLYGEQAGHCAGCGGHFPIGLHDVDHVVPRRYGGTDHPTNLQLLCRSCNTKKGTGSMSELMTKLLAERGQL